ncbi:MAG: DUF3194 domain-containing protein [Halobacteriaceae archaeon]
MPEDEEIVETATDAAQDVIFSRLRTSTIEDYDLTVTYEDGILNVDIYLNAPESGKDTQQIVDDAVLAAEAAVDDLFSS